MNNRPILPLVLAALAVWWALGKPVPWSPDGPAPNPAPSPSPVPGAPTVELQGLVGPITGLLAGKPGAAATIAAYYRDGASVIGRDTDLRTTGQVRLANTKALSLVSESLGVPGLSAAIDNVLMKYVGDDEKALDPATRARVVEAFNAISWAAGQAG